MMKRLSLKGLRLSTHPGKEEDDVYQPQEEEIAEDSVSTRPTTTSSTTEGGSEILPSVPDDTAPGTPKKREKKGFFKTLKRKLTGNFKGKRDSVTGVVVVDEDSSSEARDDGSLHCGPRAFHSPRRPVSIQGPPSPRPRPDVPAKQHDLDLVLAKQKRHGEGKPLTEKEKEELSKSEEERASLSTPTEEENIQGVFLTDAEYGHASAPFPLATTTTVEADTGVVPVVVCHPEPGSDTLPDGLAWWPPGSAPLPPPSPGVDSVGGAGTGGSSDSETQGACAPRTPSRLFSRFTAGDADQDLPPLRPPPPPPASPGRSYDTSTNNFRGHLALVGGGITGDPSKLLPVYDQLKEPPKSWSLTKELFKLSKFGWYWGPITRVEAEEKLNNQTDGAFLVRDSSDERYLLSLSFRSYGRTLHTRIEHCNGVFSFYAQPESEGYYSIVDLIEHSMNDSQTGVFCYSRARTPGSPSFPVRLTKPVSRFTQVRSLQYLCRFVIRQYTRFDHIQKLPLPPRIKGWLEENQY